MNNIMLVFPYNIENKSEFNYIINKFDEKNYYIHIFDELDNCEFNIDVLPDIISNLKKEYKNINKIVVLSNLKEIIFSWYRCYNSLVDDFIFFIDDKENSILKNDDVVSRFIKDLSDFVSIEKESVEGKIYINIDFKNYKKIFSFLLQNKFKYFENINNFDHLTKKQKKNIEKSYKYEEIVVDFDCNSNDLEKETLILSDKENDKIIINDVLINELANNIYFIQFLLIEALKEKNQHANNFLKSIFNKLDNYTKEKVLSYLYEYVNKPEILYDEKLYALSFVSYVYPESNLLIQNIMKTILNKNNCFDYDFEVFMQTIMYISNLKCKIYDNYYLDSRNFMKKLSNYIENDLNLKSIKYIKDTKCIAIVVDQLLSILHSPTKVILDYALNLKKYYSEYKIKIFVEDDLYCNNIKSYMPYAYSSVMSESVKNEHKEYINGSDIEIYYEDVNKSKKQQVVDTIKQIVKFKPEIILTNSYESISNVILYKFYPIAYMSMGGDYLFNYAHVYLCGNSEEILTQNEKYKLLQSEKILQFNWGLNLPNVEKKIDRSILKLNENDFVIITVGNRLNTEMDKEFIDYICSFINSKENVKWLLVGGKEISYIEDEYRQLINNRKIIRIKYEKELAALYNSCDVYINPRRHGGGISIAMAMNQSLPIAIISKMSDGLIYVGKENASGDTMEEYIKDLEKLYLDKEYRTNKSIVMKERIKSFDMKHSVDELFNIFNMVKD